MTPEQLGEAAKRLEELAILNDTLKEVFNSAEEQVISYFCHMDQHYNGSPTLRLDRRIVISALESQINQIKRKLTIVGVDFSMEKNNEPS